MALNPSNRLDNDLKGFPTLGDPPFEEECKDLAIAELREAGFPRGSEIITMRERQVYKKDSEPYKLAQCGVHVPGMAKQTDIEWCWLYEVDAEIHFWKFERAWYYWVAHADCEDYFIPKKVAEEFNKLYYREARVDGCAGGQDVRSDVSLYHIDTPRGLKAFVELIKKREEEVREAHRKMYEEYRTKARV